jgi:leucine-rich repeat protein SHOC2
MLKRNRIYPLATNANQLDSQITVLDLRGNNLTVLPLSIYKNTQLKIVLLCNNKLSSLNFEIKSLSNLSILNLNGNPISVEEQERIKKLLPNCKIEF